MGATGTAATRLIVLRGPSGAGTSSVAHALQERVEVPLAWVEQDHLRQMFLRERDVDSGAALGLVDRTVRYVLDQGIHVVLQGTLVADRYGPMLRRLRADHRGLTRAYHLQVDQHLAGELVDGLREHVVPAGSRWQETVARVLTDTGLGSPGDGA